MSGPCCRDRNGDDADITLLRDRDNRLRSRSSQSPLDLRQGPHSVKPLMLAPGAHRLPDDRYPSLQGIPPRDVTGPTARVDRLGRDTRDVLNIVHECEQRGAFVTVLDPLVSTRGEMGQVVLTVLGMVAHGATVHQGSPARRDRARQRTTRLPRRKARLDRERIRALHLQGHGPAMIAKKLGCSRMQVYRVLKAA